MKIKDIIFNKERRKQLIELRKEKEYDKILELYGSNVYNFVVPSKFRNEEIKSLLNSGRFEDIYRKYGENVYNSYLHIMKQKEIEFETGSKVKGFWPRIQHFFKKHVFPIGLALVLLPGAASATTGYNMEKDTQENMEKYKVELQKYNDRTDEYIQNVNWSKLSDTQIFMKVVDDMWKDIEGYGEAKIDAMGLYRLDFAEKGGVGVCKNMADHVTSVLNRINPKYNARNLCVKINPDSSMQLANIQRNIVETNDTVVEENSNENNAVSNAILDTVTDFIGNHMVTAVDIPDKEITLIIDSTNPSLGVYQNGKIMMFWSEKGHGIDMANMGTSMYAGTLGMLDVTEEIAKSFLNAEYSKEELEGIYGVDAQNLALEQVRKMYPEIEIAVPEKTKDIFEKYKVEKQPIVQKQSLGRNDENLSRSKTQNFDIEIDDKY